MPEAASAVAAATSHSLGGLTRTQQQQQQQEKQEKQQFSMATSISSKSSKRKEAATVACLSAYGLPHFTHIQSSRLPALEKGQHSDGLAGQALRMSWMPAMPDRP